MYVNPYYVATHYSTTVEASKHYYMNSQRIASALINQSFVCEEEEICGLEANEDPTHGDDTESGGLRGVAQNLSDLLSHFRLTNGVDYSMDTLQKMTHIKHSYSQDAYNTATDGCGNEDAECHCAHSIYWAELEEFDCSDYSLIYWYHPDYLGNTEYITDMSGEAFQYFWYSPWGESWVEEHSGKGSYESPYRFNAKELDGETGLYYYGARYYNPSGGPGWLSVDPLAHKFPWQTPYAFTDNNPVNYVDPTGMSAEPVYDQDGNHLGNTAEGFSGEVLIYSGSEEMNFSDMSASEAKQMKGISTLNDEVGTGSISNDAFSNIMTNIAEHFDGSEIFNNVNFNFGEVGGKVHSGDDPQAQFFYEDNKIFAVQDARTMDYTVENVRSGIIAHEYYSHHILGQSDARGNHRLSYMNEMKYINRHNLNVTQRYKNQTLMLLRQQIKIDNPNLNVDAMFNHLSKAWKR